MQATALTDSGPTLPPGWRRHIHLAMQDVGESLKLWRLWMLMATNDIAQRYRRSLIGPFWLTLSTGIMILALGLVYSYLFKIPVHEYLPYLAAGQVVWTLMSSILLEAGSAFVAAEGYLKQVRIPKLAFILQLVTRNLIILLHNMVIYIIVWLIYQPPLGWQTLLFIPGLILILVAGTAAATMLSVICARFRDMPQIVISLLQVVYFLTPVMWRSNQLNEGNHAIIKYNPFLVFLDIARGPLLGEMPSAETWVIAVGLTVLTCIPAFFFFARFRARITYWL
ncbi:MAG: ABC transporter permease [Alphaproteobacteria bacterium]|nr:ABC transporter permease [Alphaproteobacteria bacterium]